VPNLRQFTALKILLFSFNSLKKLENETRLPATIEIVDFSDNEIELIGETFFAYFDHLKELYLDRNNLKHLQKITFTSNYLKVVSMEACQMEAFDEIRFDSSQALFLDKLTLSKNLLQAFPNLIGNLKEVKSFHLAGQKDQSPRLLVSKLSYLVDHFKDRKIGHLDLRNNSLSEIVCDVHSALPFESVDLSHNNLDKNFLICLLNRAENGRSDSIEIEFWPQLKRDILLECPDLLEHKSSNVKFKHCPKLDYNRVIKDAVCEDLLKHFEHKHCLNSNLLLHLSDYETNEEEGGSKEAAKGGGFFATLKGLFASLHQKATSSSVFSQANLLFLPMFLSFLLPCFSSFFVWLKLEF
jgi:hypothetical protein